jgi:hypothetical protein
MRSWIPLARVAREHGLTKGETSFLRCDLLQVGGLAFEATKMVAFSSQIDGPDYDPITLTEATKPLGGKWGQAKAVIIPIHKNKKWTRGDWVSVPREMFPRLEDTEIYLCDLMGLGVVKSFADELRYRVQGIEDRSKGTKEAIALVIKDLQTTKTFEVPVKSIDWTQSTADTLVIDAIEDWRDL